ncbi:unnamed protein product [Cylicocyclus nassatus]|uniref:Uncharacterized protein n=1 Tax=Cylicocyclus nassatus TaxID=53992 RepID=A0AA36H4I4_CYLNA|nr:unnamed protein product [Cylicocyclus nassatus]
MAIKWSLFNFSGDHLYRDSLFGFSSFARHRAFDFFFYGSLCYYASTTAFTCIYKGKRRQTYRSLCKEQPQY